jgi:biopolymer transport protein ExbD
MKYERFVCLIALSLVSISLRANAQTPPMTKGVSVQMAQTQNAVAYPAADNSEAWVVTVTADGGLYFGVKPVTPERLFEEMTVNPRKRDAKLYVKADARATFSALKSALGPARSAQFEQAVLLTSQVASTAGGAIVPPRGIEVQIVPQRKDAAIDVRLFGNGQTSTLTVNEKTLAWSELESTLKNLVRRRAQVVEVEANDAVSAADVIRVIDEARKTGATVALPMFHSL